MARWKDLATLVAIHLMCASLAISSLVGDYEQNNRSDEVFISSGEDSLAPDALSIEEPDPARETEIRLKSVRSLESLLLELFRIGGNEVCSAPFARDVKLGTWRYETPDDDEMRASRELRRACHNAPAGHHQHHSDPVAIPQGRNRALPIAPVLESAETQEASSVEEVAIQIKPPLVPSGQFQAFSAKLTRFSPEIAPTKKPDTLKQTAQAKDMQKMNEILKDRSAECKPRKIPVEIPKEPNMTLLPACALVERCGGCCKHESLQCVPLPESITQMKKKVVVVSMDGALLKLKEVTLEKHNKCKCQCKIQASHCNSLQYYDKNNCRCVCKQNNLKPGGHSSESCKAPQYWDEGSCKCRCPHNTLTECSSGFFFSADRCRCVSARDIIREENAKRENRS